MALRILGVNGSPRKYGNTFKLLSVALKFAEEEGAESEIVHLYDYDIRPCMGCLCDKQEACRYPCVIEDDMRTLYEKVLGSDGIIIATPIYWYSPPSIVKAFIDRLTAFENMIFIDGRSWLEGKVAGVIAVGNDSGSIQVVSLLYSILNSMGLHIPPWALAYYHSTGDALDSWSSVLDAANVGRAVYLACAGERPKEWYLASGIEGRLRTIIERVRREAEEQFKRQYSERAKIIYRLMEGS